MLHACCTYMLCTHVTYMPIVCHMCTACICFFTIGYFNFYHHFMHQIFTFFSNIIDFEWIGWRNDTPNMIGKPVEITFEFDYIRNFSAMHLHTNNYFTKGVQVWIDFAVLIFDVSKTMTLKLRYFNHKNMIFQSKYN